MTNPNPDITVGKHSDDEPLVIVSSDSHIGPRLDDLRAYCPEGDLAEFDDYVEEHRSAAEARSSAAAHAAAGAEAGAAQYRALKRNLKTAGHFDMRARLRDLDRDGVSCEVVYHGSQNNEPIPFQPIGTRLFEAAYTAQLALGYQIYNDWLADAVSIEPERHIGLAYLPMWDVDEAVAGVARAQAIGLRGVNFPAPRPGIAEYDDPQWEPFWSACETLGMVLATHSGGGVSANFTGVHAPCMLVLETGGWPSRRGIGRMVFGGVFERHPGLRFLMTESPGEWFPAMLREFDSIYETNRWRIQDQIPRLPSEYCRNNVFHGASFIAPWEAEAAVREQYDGNILWGSDYPHSEGTWQYFDDEEVAGRSMTRLSLRYAFAGCSPAEIRGMVGQNAVRAFGLDASALAAVARRIDAPSASELTTPIETIPKGGGFLAFRQVGPYG